MPEQNRQLAAILFTDIVGYTAMMQQDEKNAVAITRRYTSVLRQFVVMYNGKILNDYGDGNLCSFSSATEAIKCAIEIQKHLRDEPAVPLRIGLHVGELFFEEAKVMGDGVNVASRIQSLGQANTILFSKDIFDKLKNQPEYKSVSLGRFNFKNVDEPIEVFALANEGLAVPKRQDLSGKLKETKNSRLKKWITFTSIGLLLIAVFFIYKNISIISFNGEKSIAVLPFENIGSDTNEEYISDGITQDIINNLSKISSLEKVIGWFSVRSFKKTTKSLQQIADELGVAAILSGTIQKRDGKTRIITELIEVHSNKRLWGNDFEYEAKDILSIQSKVATEIVSVMSASITPEDRKKLHKSYTDNVDAYKLYRRGRAFWDKRNRESYDSAEANYKRAIELDADYALAYAGLADCYTFNQKGLLQAQAIPIARAYTNKALSIDSSLTEALTTQAFIQSHFDYDWAGARTKFEKIIKENPNYAIAHLYYGNVLAFTGHTEESLAETRKALSLDPLSSAINHVLGRNYFYLRKYDSAIIQLQKTLALNPNFVSSYMVIGNAFIQKKLFSSAIDAFSKLPPGVFDQGNNGTVTLAYGYAAAGDTAKVNQLLSKFSKETLISYSYFMSYIYVTLGNKEEALFYLEKAYETKTIALIHLNIDPILDPLRNEPRFKALLKKMNFD